MSAPAHLDPDLELLSPEEAAQILKMPAVRTLERWRCEGSGPAFVRVGRKIAYTRHALKQYIAMNTRNSTGER